MEKQLDYDSLQLKEKLEIQELQNLIGKHLADSSKTEDDLIRLIPNARYEQIVQALKNMLFLKLITKEGFPVKYSLSSEVKDKLTERKRLSENDKNTIKVAVIIESKSNDKLSLRKGMEQILESLKNDNEYLIYDSNLAEIVVHDDLFSTYISATLSCNEINSLFKLIYFYGATSVEVLKPDKLNVTISDLQNTIMIITDMTHGYAQMIHTLKKENEALSKLR
ncbi:MAG TPA: hypothetical protein P5530_00440 [Candidatus Diapherotrites archaeon]|nr:hypothetical protein [Candidatus Diapherotrites archaeon]